jgi:hypothetical protein
VARDWNQGSLSFGASARGLSILLVEAEA